MNAEAAELLDHFRFKSEAEAEGQNTCCDEPIKARHMVCVCRAYNRRLKIARYCPSFAADPSRAH